MEQGVNLSMEGPSKMKISLSNTTKQDYYLWLMLDLTPMDHNFLSLLPKHHGLMENTQYSVNWLKGKMCLTVDIILDYFRH